MTDNDKDWGSKNRLKTQREKSTLSVPVRIYVEWTQRTFCMLALLWWPNNGVTDRWTFEDHPQNQINLKNTIPGSLRFLSVFLFLCFPVSLFPCLFVSLSFCFNVSLFLCRSVSLFLFHFVLCLSLFLSLCLFSLCPMYVSLSLRLSFFPSFCSSVADDRLVFHRPSNLSRICQTNVSVLVSSPLFVFLFVFLCPVHCCSPIFVWSFVGWSDHCKADPFNLICIAQTT